MMGIISKPNIFTGQTAPQLPWLDADLDAIYTEINGNLDNANIKSGAAIAQSKIANLVTDLAALLGLAGGTMTGPLIIRFNGPYLRLTSSLGTADWQIGISGSALIFAENTNIEASPIWVTRYTLRTGGTVSLTTDLAPKSYVDAQVLTVSNLAFSKVVKSNGDVTTSSTSFEDVSGLSTAVTTGSRRVRVSFIGNVVASSANTRIASINLQIDGVNAGGTDGLVAATTTDNDRPQNVSFAFVTNILTAASHTFKIQIKVASGSAILLADTTRNAILIVEELPTSS